MKVRSPFAVVLLAGALLLGTACSSSGDDDAAPDTSPTTSADTGTETTTTTDDDETTTTEADGSDRPGEADYVDALAESMRVDAGAVFTDEQADCYAPRIVEILDAERLADAGVTPEELADSPDLEFPDVDLDEEQANAAFDVYEECGLDIRSIFIDGMLAGSGLDDEEVACVESVVTDDKIRALMVGMIVEGEDDVDSIPEVAEFGEELQACVGD